MKEELKLIREKIAKLSEKSQKKLQREGVIVCIPIPKEVSQTKIKTKLQKSIVCGHSVRHLFVLKDTSSIYLEEGRDHIRVSVSLVKKKKKTLDKLRIGVSFYTQVIRNECDEYSVDIVLYTKTFIDADSAELDCGLSLIDNMQKIIGETFWKYMVEAIDFEQRAFDNTGSVVEVQRTAKDESLKLLKNG